MRMRTARIALVLVALTADMLLRWMSLHRAGAGDVRSPSPCPAGFWWTWRSGGVKRRLARRRAVLSVGMGYAAVVVTLLLLSYIPGLLPTWYVFTAFDLLMVALVRLFDWRWAWPTGGGPRHPASRSGHFAASFSLQRCVFGVRSCSRSAVFCDLPTWATRSSTATKPAPFCAARP